ncbi:hypothetical protein [Haloplanus salilacus]|uniref:hypothetical protein n=1 Tax=Haloplanus salilacus TaxID=2949994 RepID=UPI0030D09DCB
MARTVNIEVICDSDSEGGIETFGVASEHRPDLPEPFNNSLQEWVRENFENELDKGQTISEAGEMVYEPNGGIIEFRTKD